MSPVRIAALQEAFLPANAPGFGSSCDFPSSLFYKELMLLYSNAKVVLTVRDSPEQWWRSASRTILNLAFVMEDARQIRQLMPGIGVWLLVRLNPLIGHLLAVPTSMSAFFPGGIDDAAGNMVPPCQ